MSPEQSQALHDLLDFLLLDHPEVVEHSKLLKDAATTVLDWFNGVRTENTSK
jgi:hypothetical protein